MISDEQIIQGCIEGKRKAFAALYRKYAAVMMAVCYRYSGNRPDAEDILQEGFIKVFTHIGDFRGQGSFEGWVRRIMVNTALDHYQKVTRIQYASHMEEFSTEDDRPDEGPESGLPDNPGIPAEKLMDFIAALPHGYRTVFNLYVFEGFTHREIASATGMSENTSKTQLMKARRSLRNKVAQWVFQTNTILG
jgi:RNA polymerase sigma-70 factor (ECF subfamily)